MIRKDLRDDALRDDRMIEREMPTDRRAAKSWNNEGLWTVIQVRGYDMMDA